MNNKNNATIHYSVKIYIPQYSLNIDSNIKTKQDALNVFKIETMRNNLTGETLSYSKTTDNSYMRIEYSNTNKMSIETRQFIADLLYNNSQGDSQISIANTLGVSQPTISRDLKQLRTRQCKTRSSK